VLADGGLLVGGQRGTLLRGSADGTSWQRIALDSRSSITAIAVEGSRCWRWGWMGCRRAQGRCGATFALSRSEDGASLTAALAGGVMGRCCFPPAWGRCWFTCG
jgi:hypothetical protein